jgi:hypothetical protein
MSQKTTLEGTYRWIPVAQELPDDSETVLVCNLDDWSDPVRMGALIDGEWNGENEGLLSGFDADCLPCLEYYPPTHWMRLPEPPGVAIVPEVPAAENPFRASSGGEWGTVEDRLHVAKNFDAAKCRAALNRDDLQKTVRTAIERRLRKLEKGVAK